jgi:hypothetical protein
METENDFGLKDLFDDSNTNSSTENSSLTDQLPKNYINSSVQTDQDISITSPLQKELDSARSKNSDLEKALDNSRIKNDLL